MNQGVNVEAQYGLVINQCQCVISMPVFFPIHVRFAMVQPLA